MYKPPTNAKETDDLSIGFDQDRNRRQRELNTNKNIKGKRHVRNMLENVFGIVENHGKSTFGLLQTDFIKDC